MMRKKCTSLCMISEMEKNSSETEQFDNGIISLDYVFNICLRIHKSVLLSIYLFGWIGNFL